VSGNRQHVLPRFLLAGFESRRRRTSVYTWMFRRGETPLETNVINVGVQRDFYSTGATPADDEITRRESSFAKLVATLRDLSDGTRISNDLLPEFVAHLVARSNHLRSSLAFSSEYLVKRLRQHFSDPGTLLHALQRSGHVERELNAAFSRVKASIPKSQRRRVERLVTAFLPRFLDSQKHSLAKQLEFAIAKIQGQLPNLVAGAHNKALSDPPKSGSRIDCYRNLTWTIHRPSFPLILGDSGCYFEVAQPGRFTPVNDEGRELLGAFLPIDHRTVAVGRPPGRELELAEAVRAGAARTSLDFFVGPEPSPDMETLHQQIGSEAALITDAELEAIVAEGLESARSTQPKAS
jgi:uncharacterized protein DUF4238